MNDLITSFKGTDGNEYKIDTRISIGTLRKAQQDGHLKKDLLTQMLKRSVKQDSVDVDDMVGAAYVAYSNAGGKMPYSEFLEILPLDFEILGNIFSQMVTGGKPVDVSAYRKEIEKNTKKPNHHHQKRFQN